MVKRDSFNTSPFFVLALSPFVAFACGGSVDSTDVEPEQVMPAQVAPRLTCSVLATNNNAAPELWQVVPTDAPNPVPALCEDWKNGMWLCPRSACLPSGYEGTCRMCNAR